MGSALGVLGRGKGTTEKSVAGDFSQHLGVLPNYYSIWFRFQISQDGPGPDPSGSPAPAPRFFFRENLLSGEDVLPPRSGDCRLRAEKEKKRC
jgi:hypothetical protein